MFTLAQARAAIDDNAAFARGVSYAREGRVLRMKVHENEGLVAARATVRGHGQIYEAEFTYMNGRLLDASCGCPAFAKDGVRCKHVAAAMAAACFKKPEARKPAMADALRERMLRMREEAEAREREEREALLRAQNERYVNQLIAAGNARRMRALPKAAQEEKVRLYPVLAREGDALELGLKIGRTRAYVVRNLWDFAQRVERGERMVYGKELVFGHGEDEVDARDAALLGHIVLLAQGLPRKTEMLLRGAPLDQTMRLLLGREVLVRAADGETSPAVVTEGDVHLSLAMERTRGGARMRVRAENVLLGSTGAYSLEAGKVVCAFGASFDRVAGLLRVAVDCPQGLALTREQLPAVCAQVIAPAQALTTVTEGQELLLAHTPLPMTARFYVDEAEGDALTCRVAFDYGGQLVAPGEATPHVRRDAMMEDAAVAAVRTLFPASADAQTYRFDGDDDARFALLSGRLQELGAYGEVMVSERLTKKSVTQRRSMSIGLSPSGTELLVQADLGGLTQQELDAAYAAYRQKRRYVRLADGTFLSGDALAQVAEAAELTQSLDIPAEKLKKGASVPLSRAMYLEQATKERESVKLSAPSALRDWMQRLEAARSTRAAQPQSLQATLRPYQAEGLAWLCALGDAGFGGILADDMGLGKTIQALAMLLREKEQGRRVRALVVCPASLQLNWQNEAKRFAPSLTCAVLSGAAKARHAQIADEGTELLITSYDQLRRDVQAYAGVELTHALLDEAQYIKNAAAQATKAAKALKAQRRFAMTGTPIENRLSELWSIFDFLMPGYLYSYKKFRAKFEAPVVQEGDERARKNLRMMTAPFILRRMKRDVLDDLPEKVETVMTSELTAEQRRVYQGSAAKLIDESKGGLADAKARIRLLAGLTRLRQICCDPRLCLEGYEGGSGKLAQVLELARDMAQDGHRMLIFSQFTSMLALLEEELAREGIACYKLTGDTDKEERMRLVEAFNTGDTPVFLISLKAGGTGLNLTGADVVIHYDPWWNTAAQNQATDRAYRIGQTRGVQVISLIAAGTIEERILMMQEEKRALSDGVLLGEETLFTLDADALQKILRG